MINNKTWSLLPPKQPSTKKEHEIEAVISRETEIIKNVIRNYQSYITEQYFAHDNDWGQFIEPITQDHRLKQLIDRFNPYKKVISAYLKLLPNEKRKVAGKFIVEELTKLKIEGLPTEYNELLEQLIGPSERRTTRYYKNVGKKMTSASVDICKKKPATQHNLSSHHKDSIESNLAIMPIKPNISLKSPQKEQKAEENHHIKKIDLHKKPQPNEIKTTLAMPLIAASKNKHPNTHQIQAKVSHQYFYSYLLICCCRFDLTLIRSINEISPISWFKSRETRPLPLRTNQNDQHPTTIVPNEKKTA